MFIINVIIGNNIINNTECDYKINNAELKSMKCNKIINNEATACYNKPFACTVIMTNV